jgi:hypothetical protein
MNAMAVELQNLHFEDLPDYLTIDELRQYLRIGSKKAKASYTQRANRAAFMNA